ncbi:hypothetical protein [Synechococcus sp. MIT S9507]|uniref:hypothetical protein n=1 Tax=Synechococcus sp. MIT S9507 TaxID=3082544 RepID=UPI0039B56943
MINPQRIALAIVICAASGLSVSCSQSTGKTPTSTGLSSNVYDSAKKALEENGFSGYEPSGEVHISGTPAIAEIVYSNGEKTVEVDIEKDSGSIVKIEEEVDLDSIPANIVEKAKSSGVDLATCQIYQAAKSSSGELEGYEFDDCELSKKDVDVDVDTLDVDVESNDSTTRDS